MTTFLATHRLAPCGSGVSSISVRLTGLLCLAAALRVGTAAAQDVSLHVAASPQCIELNQTALILTASGKLGEAEAALSAALLGGAGRPQDWCVGLVLSNLAALMTVSGRLAEAEVFAQRSLSILEKSYPPEDPVLLRPLQILAAAR